VNNASAQRRDFTKAITDNSVSFVSSSIPRILYTHSQSNTRHQVSQLCPYRDTEDKFDNGNSNYTVQKGAYLFSLIPTMANITHEQAANSLSNLKMNDPPAKKIDFSVMDKENIPATSAATSTTAISENKLIVEIVKPIETPKVAPGIKAQETDEPLLQENPHRFVLFPIKYHEVRVHFRTLRVKWIVTDMCRYGKCTRKPRRPSGLQKKSTYPKISMIGVNA
jgi:hypothetical protein